MKMKIVTMKKGKVILFAIIIVLILVASASIPSVRAGEVKDVKVNSLNVGKGEGTIIVVSFKAKEGQDCTVKIKVTDPRGKTFIFEEKVKGKGEETVEIGRDYPSPNFKDQKKTAKPTTEETGSYRVDVTVDTVQAPRASFGVYDYVLRKAAIADPKTGSFDLFLQDLNMFEDKSLTFPNRPTVQNIQTWGVDCKFEPVQVGAKWKIRVSGKLLNPKQQGVIEGEICYNEKGKKVTKKFIAYIQPGDPPVLEIAPVYTPLHEGENFTISLYVHNITHLWSWQTSMIFDPNILRCLNFTEGPFLATGGTTLWEAGTINNTSGMITNYSCTLTEGSTPVNGTGSLGNVTFQNIGYGLSLLNLTDVKLLYPNSTEIPINVIDGYAGQTPSPPLPDFGDAPDPWYPSLNVSNGASHLLVGYEWLGTNVSTEADSKQVDFDESDDGVTFAGDLVPGGNLILTVTISTSVTYNITNPNNVTYLNAWIDWNRDGDWTDAGEKIIGTGSSTGTQKFAGNATTVYNVPIPEWVGGCYTWLRFRLDYAEDAGANPQPWTDPSLNQEKGQAMYGEVEDYKIKIKAPPCVGGFAVPIDISVDKPAMLAPYVSLASTILVATAATAIYVKRVKRRKEKQ